MPRARSSTRETPQPEPETSRGIPRVRKRMELETKPGEPKMGWDLKADSMVQMMAKAERLCKEHNKRWPQDVIVWD